jgi:hypothetical protein
MSTCKRHFLKVKKFFKENNIEKQCDWNFNGEAD